MTITELDALFRLLKSHGVAIYRSGELHVEFAAPAVAAVAAVATTVIADPVDAAAAARIELPPEVEAAMARLAPEYRQAFEFLNREGK